MYFDKTTKICIICTNDIYMKEKQILKKLEVMLLLIAVVTLVASCQGQKMKSPPDEFRDAKFIMSKSESRDGPIAGSSAMVSMYGIEVVVSRVDADSVHVKFPVIGIFRTFSLSISDVHDGFSPGDVAFLKMEYFDASPNAKWKYDLNRK